MYYGGNCRTKAIIHLNGEDEKKEHKNTYLQKIEVLRRLIAVKANNNSINNAISSQQYASQGQIHQTDYLGATLAENTAKIASGSALQKPYQCYVCILMDLSTCHAKLTGNVMVLGIV